MRKTGDGDCSLGLRREKSARLDCSSVVIDILHLLGFADRVQESPGLLRLLGESQRLAAEEVLLLAHHARLLVLALQPAAVRLLAAVAVSVLGVVGTEGYARALTVAAPAIVTINITL